MKLEGVGGPEEAALLRGARLLIRRSDRAPLQDRDEFYVQVRAAAAPSPGHLIFPPAESASGAPAGMQTLFPQGMRIPGAVWPGRMAAPPDQSSV